MSEAAQMRPSDSLLYSDQLFRVLGGDAMQILRCGICMEFFDVPIVLPCGHTFCLHCLTEMCKHASRNCMLSPLKDLRIGCPNCRVLIYASPILDRNVTCNFIIQSLIECLRARQWGKKESKSVNTDEVRVGSKIRAVSDLEMERVIKEMDRMTESLSKCNIIDNSYLEIDEIRRQHLAAQTQRLEGDDDQLQHKPWSHNRSVHQYPKLQQEHQTFYQQQKQGPRAFNWEELNSHIKTVTTPSSFHQRQQILKPNFKFQQLQPQQQQQQTAQFQLRVLPQQQQHTQQVWSNMPKMSKMATVLPQQRCPDVSQPLSSPLGQFDLSSGHSSRLDNDPAVMSYSYKAAINPINNK